jgi:hypothetical protein
MEARVVKTRLNVGWVKVEGFVAGKAACDGMLMFSIGSDPSGTTYDATILRQ